MAQANDTDTTIGDDDNVRPFPGQDRTLNRVPEGVEKIAEQRPAKRRNVARSNPIVTRALPRHRQSMRRRSHRPLRSLTSMT
jgi:hypothetical protein